MILPPKFEADLQSKNLNIITRVIIEDEDKIYLSTHSINFDGNYYKPLLLNIPSMIESVDHESRNFRISNVSLDISNYEFNGERFSDSLRDNPLINKQVNIYWQTQSASSSEDALQVFRGYVRRVSHTDSNVKIELEDLTQLKLHKSIPLERTSGAASVGEKHRDVPIPMAFGYLDNAYAVLDAGRVLKADSDESVEVVYQWGDNYESHPVWGHFGLYETSGGVPSVKMKTGDAIAYIPRYTMSSILNAETDESSPLGHGQYEYTDESGEEAYTGSAPIITPFKQFDSDGKKMEVLQGVVLSKPSDISCHFRSSASYENYEGAWSNTSPETTRNGVSGWETPNRFEPRTVAKLTDNSYVSHDLSSHEMNGYDPSMSWLIDDGSSFDYGIFWEHTGWNLTSMSAQGLIRLEINSSPEFEYSALGRSEFAINGIHIEIPEGRIMYILSRTMSEDAEEDLVYGFINIDFGYVLGGGDASGVLDNGKAIYLDGYELSIYGGEFYRDYRELFEFTYGDAIDTNSNYRGHDTLTDGAIRIKDVNLIDFEVYDEGDDNDSVMESPFLRIINDTDESGEITVDVGAYCRDMAAVNAEFEAGFGGAWEEIDLLHVADLKFTTNSDFFLSVNGRTEDGEIIYNPITIMRNIAINELELDESQIDEDSYIKARDAHEDLKFAFSIKDEIESKKLFEKIAKSTLCYPYFKNNGKLTFASYKESYQPSDYNDSKIVKDVDILNFSFDKTKAEQTHTIVKFSYNYNYITEEYENVLESGLYPSDSELAYNGYETPYDNILKFESPYIRDSYTAQKVWKWMFRFYKNQHLICKLKLPLHYMDVEVGDAIRFDKLLGGMKAFGIDYTKVTNPNQAEGEMGQYYYPLFFVTSVIKSLDNIDIEAQQIHWGGGGSISEWGDLIEEDIVVPEEEEEVEPGFDPYTDCTPCSEGQEWENYNYWVNQGQCPPCVDVEEEEENEE